MSHDKRVYKLNQIQYIMQCMKGFCEHGTGSFQTVMPVMYDANAMDE